MKTILMRVVLPLVIIAVAAMIYCSVCRSISTDANVEPAGLESVPHPPMDTHTPMDKAISSHFFAILFITIYSFLNLVVHQVWEYLPPNSSRDFSVVCSPYANQDLLTDNAS